MTMGDSSDVPALRRGLAVLHLLAGRAGPVTAAAVARELDLPRSTTYHLLSELEAAGFVAHLPAERRLGWSVEDGHVTAGFASVACPVFDHGARPMAAISVTLRHVCDSGTCGETWPELAAEVATMAAELTHRIGGHPADHADRRTSE